MNKHKELLGYAVAYFALKLQSIQQIVCLLLDAGRRGVEHHVGVVAIEQHARARKPQRQKISEPSLPGPGLGPRLIRFFCVVGFVAAVHSNYATFVLGGGGEEVGALAVRRQKSIIRIALS